MKKTLGKKDTPLPDSTIIEMFFNRNERAIKEMDIKYGKLLFSIAYNILHDKSDSEECQNDTYLGVWNTIPPNKPDSFQVFISKIMRNLAIKKYKERTRKKRIPSEMTVCMEDIEYILCSNVSFEEDYTVHEIASLMNKYLNGLTDRQQYIFVGRFYMGDKLETIACQLNVNASTVYREIEKIKKGLKCYLERNGVYEG